MPGMVVWLELRVGGSLTILLAQASPEFGHATAEGGGKQPLDWQSRNSDIRQL